MWSFAFIVFGLGYYELLPKFKCTIDDVYQTCSSKQICSGQDTPQIPYDIDYEDQYSLHNWVQQLDLICVKGATIGSIGSGFFLGWAAGCLVFPSLSNKIGRRSIFLYCLTVQLGVFLGLLLSRDVYLTIGLTTTGGFLSGGRVTVGYVYMMEFLTPKYKFRVATLFVGVDAII